jgi:uncharacterized protein (TIGR03083 family)
MERSRLLQSLSADYMRLRDVAGTGLTVPVPSCPGWTVTDLVRHVGLVYLHKATVMQTGAWPDPWPPSETATEDPIALLDRGYAAVTHEFSRRGDADRALTWHARDQTVKFWIRRMAQETVIHRVDAELGAGVPLATIPEDLARDGIDEVLVAFLQYGSKAWPDEYASTLASADGRAIRLETTGASWLVRPTTDGIEVRSDDDEAADAVVRGEPVDLLLWLWNRAGDDVIATTGDPEVVAYFRRVMVAGTQ